MAGRWVSTVFLLVIGTFGLIITWRGFRAGEMPFRSDYRGPRPTLDDSPAFFYLLFVVYLCGFSILSVWGALVLFGVSPGLRWQ